jgi:hypothetical protein
VGIVGLLAQEPANQDEPKEAAGKTGGEVDGSQDGHRDVQKIADGISLFPQRKHTSAGLSFGRTTRPQDKSARLAHRTLF